MEAIKNLVYETQINYINDAGSNVSIIRRIDDNGLELNLTQIGDVCVAEETINGRVLSGRFDDKTISCGYRYDYEKHNSEYLQNLNEEIPLNEAIQLINKAKMDTQFLSAKMVLSSLLRSDYRVFALKSGDIVVTKTVVAVNENGENCSLIDCVHLSKVEGAERYQEQSKERTYIVGDDCVVEQSTSQPEVNNLKSKLKPLVDIFEKNPNNYKELIRTKESVQQTPATPTI